MVHPRMCPLSLPFGMAHGPGCLGEGPTFSSPFCKFSWTHVFIPVSSVLLGPSRPLSMNSLPRRLAHGSLKPLVLVWHTSDMGPARPRSEMRPPGVPVRAPEYLV